MRLAQGMAVILLLEQVNNVGLLILDDQYGGCWDAAERSNLLEIIDTVTERSRQWLVSQLPVEKWYGMIGEATFAAILDRLIHRAAFIGLTGEPGMRKQGINLTRDADQAGVKKRRAVPAGRKWVIVAWDVIG